MGAEKGMTRIACTLVGLGMVVATVACGAGKEEAKTAASSGGTDGPLTPKKELLGVRVYLDPNVSFTWTDNDCEKFAKAHEQTLLEGARNALSSAGLVILSDQSAPHDAVARVTSQATWCASSGSNLSNGSVEITLEPGASARRDFCMTGDGPCAAATDDPKIWGTAPETAIDKAVARLIDMPQVLALAQHRPDNTPPAALNNAPPPPAATQTPAPAPTKQSLVAGAPQPNAYAIVIGIEKYSGLPAPTGARADALHFAELAQHSLGVPGDHVKVALDAEATKGTIQRLLAWARDNTPPGGRIYFYFSGHGAPDAAAGTPYLVPSDGDPNFLTQTALPEGEVLAELSKSKAKDVLAVMDSCFSGAGGRSVLPPGARPLVRVKEATAPGQLAVFTASSGAEISGPSADGSGGVFTKYVVEGLGTGEADIDGDGQVTIQELHEWVRPRVAREAKKDNRDQNPGLTVSTGLGSPSGFVVEWGLPAK